MPKKRVARGGKRSTTSGKGRGVRKRRISSDEEASDKGSPSLNVTRQKDAGKKKKYIDEWESDQPMVEGEVEVTATTPDPESDREESPGQQRISQRIKEQQALLPKQLKDSLKRLKNLLKLPKARRWAYCEFFTADIDRALVQPDEEFRHCLREAFPDLGTRHLRQAEWRQVRRLIGKPRRYSPAFLESERQDLERKRKRIRDIQKGAALTLDDEVDLPSKIPKPLVVGSRVFARVHYPKDGIYAGIVDAIMEGRYRIIFDKDVVMPLIISDNELMSDTTGELVPVSFFLEKNKAALPTAFRSEFLVTCEKLLASDEVIAGVNEYVIGPGGRIMTSSTVYAPATDAAREERCGNYPLRMIAMFVKLSKVLEKKKEILSDLRDLNTEAELMQLRANGLTRTFQERYANVVLDLEQINRELDTYLIGIGEYTGILLPHLSEVSITSRPEALQRFCRMHASQIVKSTNITTTSVESKKSLALVTSLMSLLFQIRALGQQRRCTAYELSSLKNSIEDIKEGIDETNFPTYEDNVEINVKHIELAMKNFLGIGNTVLTSAASSME